MRLSVIAAATQRIARAAASGGGGGGGAYTSQDSTFDALYDAFRAALTISATVYIAPTGSDTAPGDGSYANPYATVSKALQGKSGNVEVVFKNGNYTSANTGIINQHASAGNLTIPNGTSGNWTIFRAETRFGVTISQTSALYYGSMVYLTSTRVWLDGFRFDHDLVPQELAPFSFGDGNLVTRCQFRTRQCGTYNGVVQYGSNCLLQDLCIYGGGRYQFTSGAYTADVLVQKSILRRCVARMDWALGDQPCGTFSIYGSDNAAWTDCKDFSRQNCIAIDGPSIPNRGSAGGKYAGFYDPKSSRTLSDIGCISLNDDALYAAFMGELSSTASNTDCAIYNTSGDGFRQSSGTRTVTQSLLTLVGGSDYNGATNSSGNRSSDTPGNLVVRSSGNGARIIYCVGAFMSFHGDTNWNTETSQPLYPWPYEDYIKSWMDTLISRPSNHYPTTNANSLQSFTGTALDGNAMTLTRRIWEAAGTAMPSLASGAGVYP